MLQIIFFVKTPIWFFTPIDWSSYSVHKSIYVVLPKIVFYDIFYFMSKYVRLIYKISCKLAKRRSM